MDLSSLSVLQSLRKDASLCETFHVLGWGDSHLFLETAAEIAGVIIAYGIGKLGNTDLFFIFHDAAGSLHPYAAQEGHECHAGQ